MNASQLDIAISKLLDAKSNCWIIQSNTPKPLYAGIIISFNCIPPEKFPFLTSKCPELAKMEENRLKYTPTETKISTIIKSSDVIIINHWASSLIANPNKQFSFLIGTNSGIKIINSWIKDIMFHPDKINTSIDFGILHTSEIINNKDKYYAY